MPNVLSLPLVDTPAQLEPPGQRATRRKGINALPDSEAVVKHSAQEIIGSYFSVDNCTCSLSSSDAARGSWHSVAYGHYIVHLEQQFDHEGSFIKLIFVFRCKHHEPKHDAIMRDRLRT
ncbi:hypothetical protein FRC11_002356, partial [Ceratobasidium sp. 423]